MRHERTCGGLIESNRMDVLAWMPLIKYIIKYNINRGWTEQRYFDDILSEAYLRVHRTLMTVQTGPSEIVRKRIVKSVKQAIGHVTWRERKHERKIERAVYEDSDSVDIQRYAPTIGFNFQQFINDLKAQLTIRRQVLLDYMLEGLTEKQIARKMGVKEHSISTMKTHIYHLARFLDGTGKPTNLSKYHAEGYERI